ncbi:MAG: P-loop NTPase [Deltaproteobacteria bacterium]
MVRRAKRIIAIGGGKGGVGKSLVASNLAVAFAQAGQRTVLIDADLGAANQHTLFGFDRVHLSLQALFAKEVDDLDSLLLDVGVPNLSLVAGCGAIPGAANIAHAQKQKLMRRIEGLDADVVVIDVGAGIAYNVVDLYTLADLRVVVLLPQLTSFQNAYAFLKAAVYRSIRDAAKKIGRQDLVDDLVPSSETDRVEDTLAQLERFDPHVATMARRRVETFGAYLIGNQIIAPKDRGTLVAVSRMFHDFLSVDAKLLGNLRFNRLIADSINARKPVLLSHPYDDCAQALVRCADGLLAADVEALRRQRESADHAAEVAARPDSDDLVMDEIQALLSA